MTVEQLLQDLIGVAQKTQGAEVWRSLFAEILLNEQQKNTAPPVIGKTDVLPSHTVGITDARS